MITSFFPTIFCRKGSFPKDTFEQPAALPWDDHGGGSVWAFSQNARNGPPVKRREELGSGPYSFTL